MRVPLILFLICAFAALRPFPAGAAQPPGSGMRIVVSGTVGSGSSGPGGVLSFFLMNPSNGASAIAVTTAANQADCGIGQRAILAGFYYPPGTAPSGTGQVPNTANLLRADLPVLAEALVTCLTGNPAVAAAPPPDEITRAMLALEDRDWNEVIRLTDAVIARAPSADTLPHRLRAKALLRTARYDDVIAHVNRILAAGPAGPVPYRLRGQAYSAKGQYDLAIADLTRAIAAMELPATAFCWHYDRAFAHQRKGDTARAAEDFALAERLEPDRTKNLYCRGVAKLKIGDTTGRADVAEAIALNPEIVREMQIYGEAGF
jgi:hypothetical protein